MKQYVGLDVSQKETSVCGDLGKDHDPGGDIKMSLTVGRI
jgi:hypothetical protein